MKKSFLRYVLSLFVLLLATAAVAQSTRLQRQTETLGDAMGETGRDVVSNYAKNYYDKDLRLIRSATYGRMYDGSGYKLSRYTVYEYDEAGRRSKTWSNQYALVTDKEMGFKASTDTTTYIYDERGQLIEEFQMNYQRVRYSYDEEGNRVKAEYYSINFWTHEESLSETVTYSDFVNGKPTRLVNESKWESSSYRGEITYNDNGNILSQKHYSTSTGALVNAEYWTYDETGFLTLYEKKNIDAEGNERDYMRTIYEHQNGNPDRVLRASQTFFMDIWSNEATRYVTVTSDYAGQQAPTLAATTGTRNTVSLTVGLPANAKADCGGVKVMDYGVVIATLPLKKAAQAGTLSADGTTLTCDLGSQLNGKHEYMVQYVELDAAGEVAEEWLVSDPVVVEVYTELPAPTNVRVDGVTKGQYGYNVTISWDAPENKDEFGFMRYNAIKKNYAVADNYAEEGLELTWTFLEVENEVTFIVQAVYELGKANTEYITINPRDYYIVEGDERLLVEEIVNYSDESKAPERTCYFYGPDDKLMRRATYNIVGEGDELTGYYKYEFAEGEDYSNATQFYAISGDSRVLVERTYDEETKKVKSEKVWNAEQTQNIEEIYTYDDNARVAEILTKQNKVRSNGKVTASTLYNTVYTDDETDEDLVTGVRYDYLPATAQWQQSATIVRHMMAPQRNYAPTADFAAMTPDSVTLNAIPGELYLNALAVFNIFCDGQLLERGVAFYDEDLLQESEYGDILGWHYRTENPQKPCEYIIQFARLDYELQYGHPYSCAPVLEFDPSLVGIGKVFNDLKDSNGLNDLRFNLQGQRVSEGYKGITIKNGKKRINR